MKGGSRILVRVESALGPHQIDFAAETQGLGKLFECLRHQFVGLVALGHPCLGRRAIDVAEVAESAAEEFKGRPVSKEQMTAPRA